MIKQLMETGKVSNFWAIDNYILRLGAIIHGLRQEGWEIDGAFGEGKNKKNFIYSLKKSPRPPKKEYWVRDRLTGELKRVA